MATILHDNVDSPALIINGVEDHIHALCLLSRKFAIMNLIEESKSETSDVPKGKYLFTSEAVSLGHPDKLADQISDGVLDALLAEDPLSRVACETMVTTGLVIVSGEITTQATASTPSFLRVMGFTVRIMPITIKIIEAHIHGT